MIYLQLFLSFLQIGMFSIGGGYVAMPLIQSEIVTGHEWLSMNEFTDLITIAEMTPGPIAINSATFVGLRIAGVFGAIVATFGCILPSCLLVSLLAFIYYRYKNVSILQNILGSLRPTVVALIATSGLSILQMVTFSGNVVKIDNFNWVGFIIFVVAFVVLRRLKWNPILVMSLCGVSGLIVNLIIENI